MLVNVARFVAMPAHRSTIFVLRMMIENLELRRGVEVGRTSHGVIFEYRQLVVYVGVVR
jgi:hypothetical protein